MNAFIFPGQGSQKVGMGKDLAESSKHAQEVFDEVDDALNQKLSRVMWEGPESELTLTSNAQPAIMANSIATLRVLEKEFGTTLADNAGCVAGHSLGEYSALCGASMFGLVQTAKLLRLRGIAMQDAVPIGLGAMAALLGADIEKASALAEAAAQGQVCEVANDNDPTQVVISGHMEAIDRAIEMAKEHGIKRGIKLPVSAPFHCSLMQPAALRMRHALGDAEAAAPSVPLFANVTAAKVTDKDDELDLLVDQIIGRVRWRESVLAMREAGAERFVEIGGKVLSPMVGRIDGEAQTVSLVTMEDLENFAKGNA
ncbi:ACP S-malonyltransferase [Qipengyuania spongiae]|uniref:Malonyl CoA-acyl carrier protein transacylase n=1 Tax=Qipengyuania spongiae TaxID=2909673 RepID=A0ABY5SVW5_9SPHN|nr:ACP S-malonyltransferase [Qipengyuania spongiae]UVI38697.1 ACP S-malonyltransferase [Qipengyuania spongiae]